MHVIGIVIAAIVVVSVFVLAGVAVTRQPPKFEATAQNLPRPSDDWIRAAYAATVSLYIEVDREIWQISTIFMASSTLVMGWVVTNFEKLSAQMVLVIGCASIMLVGMATLLKHRLRLFNLVHIESLKRLEQAAVGGNLDAANYWGVYHIRNCLRAGSHPVRWATSIHGLIDIYLVLFTLIWIALWLIKK
jgi:uncharacterized membrane protein (DUF485 family)